MIVFIYGEDIFRSTEKLKKIQEEFFNKNTSNASSSVFDFNEKDFSFEFIDFFKSRGLFSPHSFLVAKNFLNHSKDTSDNEILDFLKNDFEKIQSPGDVIIFWENGNPLKNSKIYKWLIKNSDSEEFKRLNDIEIKNWAKNKFLSFSVKVDPEIVDKLIVDKNGDLNAIEKEISKIVNFIGKRELDNNLRDQVYKLINSTVEANIFKTIELLSSGNKKQALEMLHLQLAQGDDPFYILSMYIYQFRNLLKIGEFYFQGRTNYADISKIIKLHPFVVQKGMQQLNGFSYKKLKDIYQQLEKIDQDAKSGKINIELGLDLLVTNI